MAFFENIVFAGQTGTATASLTPVQGRNTRTRCFRGLFPRMHLIFGQFPNKHLVRRCAHGGLHSGLPRGFGARHKPGQSNAGDHVPHPPQGRHHRHPAKSPEKAEDQDQPKARVLDAGFDHDGAAIKIR
jgi:hypothetical protein